MPNEFKHITVTPEPEEDIVIFAGLGAARSEAASAETQGIPSDEMASGAFDAATEVCGTTRDDAPDCAATGTGAASESDAAGTGDVPDAYDDDLTLDDLKSPMPLKQRIVIIAVVICLIGAIVYCLAFMR